MNIEMGKKYQTRDGRSVRILCVDGPDGLCVVGIVTKPGWVEVMRWDINGRFCACTGLYPENDLISVPTKHEAWTILEKRHVVFYSDKSTAQEAVEREDPFHPCFLAHITWED